MALVGAVSIENGLECYSIYPNSLNRWRYKEFLGKLKAVAPDKVILIVENCHTHYGKFVKEYCMRADVMMP